MTLDSQDLFGLAAAMPDHVEQALRSARGVDGLPSRERIENVVVLGMGDSAIAGDILVATAAPLLSVPITIVRSYEIPAFVSDTSLVFALSYSGNTEEIVEAATEVAVQGAKLVVVASGGRLMELAGSWGAPTVRIPKDLPQARAALGYLAIPAFAILEDMGLFEGASQWVDLAVEQLRKRCDELSREGNVAQNVAAALAGKYVLVQGGSATGLVAAERWKAQINQNAKQIAFWSTQPELCHNEVIGWEAFADRTKSDWAIVSLRHDDEHPQVANRFDLINQRVAPFVSSITEVRAEGDGTLAQVLDLILIGDYVSLHLAAHNNVDPGPVPFLTTLKAELQSR
jgi:glucose/mannose-6-phosphate isomerase